MLKCLLKTVLSIWLVSFVLFCASSEAGTRQISKSNACKGKQACIQRSHQKENAIALRMRQIQEIKRQETLNKSIVKSLEQVQSKKGKQ